MPVRNIGYTAGVFARMAQYDADMRELRKKRDQRVYTKPPRGETGEASIRWGAQSDFNYSPGVTQSGAGFTLKPDENPTQPTNRPREIIWSEVSRRTQRKRVENPDDPDQYVIVARITQIVFSTPQGNVKMILRPPD